MWRMAFLPTFRHRSADQGYTSRFTALNPLRRSLSDSHSPSVPDTVNQASRNVSNARLPATRANHAALQALRGLPVRQVQRDAMGLVQDFGRGG